MKVYAPMISFMSTFAQVPHSQLTQETWFPSFIPKSCAKALNRYTAKVDLKINEIFDELASATEKERTKLKVGLVPSGN